MLTRTTTAFCFISVLITLVCSDERIFASNHEIHDEGHIKEHLEGKIDVSKLTEDQKRFHYFSMSDLDKDNRIDGIEIIKALNHDHQQSPISRKVFQNEDDMVSLIDAVLKEMDINGDGYIDYAEYAENVKRHINEK